MESINKQLFITNIELNILDSLLKECDELHAHDNCSKIAQRIRIEKVKQIRLLCNNLPFTNTQTVNLEVVKNVSKPKLIKKRRNTPIATTLQHVAELYSQGKTLEEIAKEINVNSPSTVRNYIIRIKGKNYARPRK